MLLVLFLVKIVLQHLTRPLYYNFQSYNFLLLPVGVAVNTQKIFQSKVMLIKRFAKKIKKKRVIRKGQMLWHAVIGFKQNFKKCE